MNKIKKYKRVLLVFIPPFVCLLGLKFIDDIDYYPLLFGLIIGFSNWNIHKFKPYLGTVLSVVVSYVSYGLGILSFFVFLFLIELINKNTSYRIGEDDVGIYFHILSPYIIAPLLVFYFYKFVFNVPKTRKTIWIIVISICLLLGLKLFIEFLAKDYIISFQDYKFLGKFEIWQFIMALALQLILYQEELKSFFKSKKVA